MFVRVSAGILIVMGYMFGVAARGARAAGQSEVPWTVQANLIAPRAAPPSTNPSGLAVTPGGTPAPGALSAADPLRIKPNLNVTFPYPAWSQVLIPATASKYALLLGQKTQLWDLKRGAAEILPQAKWGTAMRALSADGQFVAGEKLPPPGQAPTAGQIEVWSLRTGKRVSGFTVEGGFPPPRILGFAGDATLVISKAKALSLYTAATGELRAEIPMDQNFGFAASKISPSGKYLAVVASQGLRLYDLEAGKLAGEVPMEAASGTSFYGTAFSPDGKEIAVLASGSRKMEVTIVDAGTGKVIAARESPAEVTHETEADSIAYSPDASALLVGWEYVVDRASLVAAARLPERKDALYARWADPENLLQIYHTRDRLVFASTRVPRGQISAAVADIADGGKLQDAALAHAVHVDISAAKSWDWSHARRAPWAVHPPEPEPPKPFLATNFHIHVVPLPAEGFVNQLDDISALLFTSAQTHAMFVQHGIEPLAPQPDDPFHQLSVWVERRDYSGTLTGEFAIPTTLQAVDASPSGKSLACRGGCGIDRVEIWSQDKGPFKATAAFRPFGSAAELVVQLRGKSDPNAVRWAGLVDDTHIVVQSAGWKVAMFEFPSPKMIWQSTVDFQWPEAYDLQDSRCMPALSPDRKLLAVPSNGGITLVDALTGAALNAIGDGSGEAFVHAVAFSPDGRQVATVGDQEHYTALRVYDLGAGTMTCEIPLPPAQGSADRVAFASPGCVMVGDELISLEKKSPIWRYQPPLGKPLRFGSANPSAALFYAFPESRRNRTLASVISVQVPHKAAQEAQAGLNADDLYLWHPGMSVTLQLTIVGNEDNRKEQLQKWTTLLKEGGFDVVENSPNVLRLTTTVLTSPGVQHPTLDRQQSVLVHEYKWGHDFSLTVDGKEIWKSVDTAAPRDQPFRNVSAYPKAGETLQQAWDRTNPPPAVASVITLPPSYILKARDEGISTLGARGVEDVSAATRPVATRPSAPRRAPQSR